MAVEIGIPLVSVTVNASVDVAENDEVENGEEGCYILI
jgi:hypothetical protein